MMKSRCRPYGATEWTESTHINHAPSHLNGPNRESAYVVGLMSGCKGATPNEWFTVTATSFQKAIDEFVESEFGEPLRLDADDLATGDWGTADNPTCQFTGSGVAYDTDWLLYGPEGAEVEVAQLMWVCPHCRGTEFHVNYDERRSARVVQPAALEGGEVTYFPVPDYNNSVVIEVNPDSFTIFCDNDDCPDDMFEPEELEREERFKDA